MSDVIKRIEQDCPNELQSVFEEADGHSSTTGKSLRASWDRDKVNCKNKIKFYSDQRKNGMLYVNKCCVYFICVMFLH